MKSSKYKKVKHARNRIKKLTLDLKDAIAQLNKTKSMRIQLAYQQKLIAARDDDDVFHALFTSFSLQSGPVFGVAITADENENPTIAGRFGIPMPDPKWFCDKLVQPVIEDVLKCPGVRCFDATDCTERFDESIRRYLVGVNVLVVPLLPRNGQLIGLVVLYRKGEQPFTTEDIDLAKRIGKPTAVAVEKNE